MKAASKKIDGFLGLSDDDSDSSGSKKSGGSSKKSGSGSKKSGSDKSSSKGSKKSSPKASGSLVDVTTFENKAHNLM